MTAKILTFLLPFLVPFSYSLHAHSLVEKIPETDKIALKIIDQTSVEMSKKYPVSQIGFGINQSFEYLEISLQMFKICSQSSLRLILFDCASTFLEKINSSEEFRPFLSKFPVTEKDIGIILFPRSEKNEDLLEPDFCCASFRRGEFNYHTKSKENRYVYKDTFSETYEEALKLIDTQGETP